MFIPEIGKIYTSDVSDLSVKVYSVESSDRLGVILANIVITNKRNGIFYQHGTFRLTLDNIQHWREI
jgi:hypothetical protein